MAEVEPPKRCRGCGERVAATHFARCEVGRAAIASAEARRARGEMVNVGHAYAVTVAQCGQADAERMPGVEW